MVEWLADLVSHESPSNDPALLAACADVLTGWGEAALGRPATRVVRDGRPHLLWRAPKQGVLLLGHFDTVWPSGTTAQWPMTVVDGVARGPGVFDMKAGIVQMLTALELVADTSRVSLLLTCDEETGSHTSRELIEQEARRAGAILVCEPSADGGAAKVARKGTADYRIMVTGRAAHAGLEPELGVNAGIELAHQVLALEALASPEAGTSVTPTALAAGTTTNTVPETAVLNIDARAWSRAEMDRVDAEIRALMPSLPGASLAVAGGINRYPLEPAMALPLLPALQAAAQQVGVVLPEAVRSGGGSDGNLTAGIGVPTLDGLGAVGGHPHARSEWVDVTAMPRRAELLAALIDRICAAADAKGAATGAGDTPA
ncbi:MAG: M20 family metallopeptidase [Dactylosporangium sp.]|nr:M20 family metallopeptidase [Dactylosporangium sp.]NNJ60583.1 M20 family metallopeptidase [Dactylosporangium sp.]